MESGLGKVPQWTFAGALLLLAYAVLSVLAPAAGAVASAAVLAAAVHPVQAALLARFPRRSNAAAAALTVGLCLLTAGPLIVGASVVGREAVQAYPAFRERLERLRHEEPPLPAWVPASLRAELSPERLAQGLADNLDAVGLWTGRALSGTVKGALFGLLDVILFVLFLFFFLREGAALLERGFDFMGVDRRERAAIASRTKDMIAAIVRGVFAVALLQGALAAIGFALFGVRFAFLLGAGCGLLSILPFIGSTLIWVPIVAFTALSGHQGQALLMALWFGVVVGLSDNVVRPLLVQGRSRLPLPVVVLGLVGGVRAFGPLGAFLGPILVALALAVFEAAAARAESRR